MLAQFDIGPVFESTPYGFYSAPQPFIPPPGSLYSTPLPVRPPPPQLFMTHWQLFLAPPKASLYSAPTSPKEHGALQQVFERRFTSTGLILLTAIRASLQPNFCKWLEQECLSKQSQYDLSRRCSGEGVEKALGKEDGLAGRVVYCHIM